MAKSLLKQHCYCPMLLMWTTKTAVCLQKKIFQPLIHLDFLGTIYDHYAACWVTLSYSTLLILKGHISPLFVDRKLFHRAVMMAGSDLCEWSVVKGVYNSNAREYAKDLGRNVGCSADMGLPLDRLMLCLQEKHFEEIVNASAAIHKHVSCSYCLNIRLSVVCLLS